MKRYSVEITSSAEADIEDSFAWGCEVWGIEGAVKWAIELRTKILKDLATSPLKNSAAPEGRSVGRELRQMIVGRYRVIYIVDGDSVYVVHLTGSFIDTDRK